MLHQQLINICNGLGYLKQDEGVCVLYAEKGIDAWLGGEVSFRAFTNINTFLKNNQLSARQIQSLHVLIRKGFITIQDIKTSEELATARQLLNLESFISEGELYYQPEAHADLFNQTYSQMNALEISQFLQPEELIAKGGRIKVNSFLGIYDYQQLVTYFQTLLSIGKQIGVRFALSLRTDKHIASFGFDEKNNTFSLIDANLTQINAIASPEFLATLTLCALEYCKDAPSSAFQTTIWSTTDQQEKALQLTKSLQLDEKFTTLHDVTAQKAAKTTQQGVTLALLAINANDIDTLQRVITAKDKHGQFIAELNQASSRSVTPIALAVRKKNQTALQYLIAAKDQQGEFRVDLDKPNAEGFTPAFHALLKNEMALFKLLVCAKNNAGEARINLNQVKDYSLVQYAAYNGNLIALKLLAEEGADLKANSDTVGSLLHIAYLRKQNEIVRFLKVWDMRNELLALLDKLIAKHMANKLMTAISDITELKLKVINDFHVDHERFAKTTYYQCKREIDILNVCFTRALSGLFTSSNNNGTTQMDSSVDVTKCSFSK